MSIQPAIDASGGHFQIALSYYRCVESRWEILEHPLNGPVEMLAVLFSLGCRCPPHHVLCLSIDQLDNQRADFKSLEYRDGLLGRPIVVPAPPARKADIEDL